MAKLSISNAWDDARPIIARDGRLMFIIALALVVLPQAVLTLIAPESGQMVEGDTESSIEAVLLGFIGGLANIIGSIAISYLALTRGASVADGLRRGLKRFLPTLGAFLILALIGIVAGLILALIVALILGVSLAGLDDATTAETLSPMVALIVIAAIALFLFVSVRLVLMTPVIAAEHGGPLAIVKRSWSLTKGHFWKLLGFLLLVLVGAIIFTGAVSIIGGLLITLVFGDVEPMTLAALLMGLLSGLAAAVITVVYSTIAARIYLQLAGMPADPAVEDFNPSVPPTV